jgi:hypothetical protein
MTRLSSTVYARLYYIKYQIAFRRAAQRRPSKHTHTKELLTSHMARFGDRTLVGEEEKR